MKWKSPRCSTACWDETKKADAELSKAIIALADMRRDRDEWKEQHENLLAIYRASLSPIPPREGPVQSDREKAQT